MESLVIGGFLISYVVQIRDVRFTSQFMNEFALPEKHNVLLMLDSFLNFGRDDLIGLLLLALIDFSKSTPANLL